MPLITVKLIEGEVTAAQKEEIIARLTDAMVAVSGENLRSVTWVLIEEVQSGAWGLGGKAVGLDDVRALQAGGTSSAPE